MDLSIQALCNAIHVIPADKVTLSQWFLRPPTMPQNIKNPSSCSGTPHSFQPPSTRKKKANTSPLAPQMRPTASKCQKDRLALPCLPPVPKEHNSFEISFSSGMIRCFSHQNNNALPAPEKAQLPPRQATQITFVEFQSYFLPILLNSAKRFTQLQPTATEAS